METRGRKKLNPNEKKQLVRVFVKQEVINAFTPTEMQQQVNEFINKLQSEAIDKCVAENYKKK